MGMDVAAYTFLWAGCHIHTNNGSIQLENYVLILQEM
jgi:hypothetical protein